MDSLNKVQNSAAKYLAKSIVGAVEKEKSRVAALEGSRYDVGSGSDAVEFSHIERSSCKRFLSGLMGSDNIQPGGWSAHASLVDGEVTEMTSIIADSAQNPRQIKELKYSENSTEKTYAQSSQESFLEDGTKGGVIHKSAVVTVNKLTGALFIELR